MSTITVLRSDVTSEEAADALRRGLGLRYNVLRDSGVNASPLVKVQPDHPGTIVVGTGNNRLFRARVRISHDGRATVLHVSPADWAGFASPIPSVSPARCATSYKLRRACGDPGRQARSGGHDD